MLLNGLWANLRHGRGPRAKVTALARRGTNQSGVEKLFHHLFEVKIRELKLCIEHWEIFNINNNSQLLCTMFLAEYCSLDLYDEDMEKIFIIAHERLQFDKILDGI